MNATNHPFNRTRRTALTAMTLAAALGLAGCGNNVADLLYQGISAAGNTALDLWLTDLANDIADQVNPPPDDGLPEGDATAGQAAYVAKGCSVCHGANAEGGSGPSLAGMNEWPELIELFGDGGVHRSRTLTDDEVEDVATWLLTLEPSEGEEPIPNGDAAAGEAAFAAADCAACHGAAGEGGSAPALADMNEFNELKARFEGGATHFGRTLSDEEIEDVATWLLGGSDGGDGGDGGDQSIGEQAFLDAGCDACHGAMAGGGAGPALAGMDVSAELATRFGGGSTAHFGKSLSDSDIDAVAAWLQSL